MNANWCLVIAVACALTACGNKKDKENTGAQNASGQSLPRQGGCDTRAANQMCVEYFGQPGDKPGITDSQKSTCEGNGGTVVEKCPTEGALGRCISNEIRIMQGLMYEPMTKEKADMMCKGMGDGKLGPV